MTIQPFSQSTQNISTTNQLVTTIHNAMAVANSNRITGALQSLPQIGHSAETARFTATDVAKIVSESVSRAFDTVLSKLLPLSPVARPLSQLSPLELQTAVGQLQQPGAGLVWNSQMQNPGFISPATGPTTDVTQLLAQAVEGLKAIYSIFQGAGGLFNGVKGAVSNGLSSATDFLGVLWSQGKDMLGGLINKGKDLLGGLLGNFGISDLITGAASIFTGGGLPAAIGGLFSGGIGKTLSNLAGKVLGGIKSFF